MVGLLCPNGQDGSRAGGVKAQSAPSMLILYVYVSGLSGIVYAQGVASQEKKLSNLLLQHTTYPLPPTTTNTPLLTHYSHLPPAGGTRHDPATRGVQPITNHSATNTSSPQCICGVVSWIDGNLHNRLHLSHWQSTWNPISVD